MDLALLGMEAASLYMLETILKGVVYSIKLKLELAVLGKLVELARGTRPKLQHSLQHTKSSVGLYSSLTSAHGRRRRATTDESERDPCDMDISEFVDLDRVSQAVNYPFNSTVHSSRYQFRRERGQQIAAGVEDRELARFEHVEEVRTWQDCIA